MRQLLGILGCASLAITAWFAIPSIAVAGGGECTGKECGTPTQSGGGGGSCGGGSVLVALTDRGETYQFGDDFDGDGIEDEFDNCAFSSNYDQIDSDGDEIGDACDVCVSDFNPDQANMDGDEFGDICDGDRDGDSVINSDDNCPSVGNVPNMEGIQVDNDGDGMGDACDPDDDNDNILDVDDDCRLLEGTDATRDGCDEDADGDGVFEGDDNCPFIANPKLNGAQPDADGDGSGDACDPDKDGDGICNGLGMTYEGICVQSNSGGGDNCPGTYNPDQVDMDFDGLGDSGNWNGGAGSCDNHECYVIGGDFGNCLDPNANFSIYVRLMDFDRDSLYMTGERIDVALFTNRIGYRHSWTTQFEMPDNSNAKVQNVQGEASTVGQLPQVAQCQDSSCSTLNTIAITPDKKGQYTIRVTATVKDAIGGESTASYVVTADVKGKDLSSESDGKGGCAATASGSLAALALGLLLIARRREN